MTDPRFRKAIVQSKREDGYWIETFQLDPKDKAPGLIGYGLGTGDVTFFDNPANEALEEWDLCIDELQPQLSSTNYSDWSSTQIAKFDSPVAVAVIDVDGDGLLDLIICYNYGPDFIDCNADGGYIAWLQNPGRDNLNRGSWTSHYIGRWPAMHRLKAGKFTQRTFLELIALPVVHGPKDLSTPILVILFQEPDDVREANGWHRQVIDDTSFTIIHDACKRSFLSNTETGLESLIIASREGLNWLYYDQSIWKRELLGHGLPKTPQQDPRKPDFWGSECVDIGKFEDDPFAYIVTLDAFHGTTVTVYTKQKTGLKDFKWKRHVLDVYGTPLQQSKQGNGPGHFVITADFDNDGNDEFLVALWGPGPEDVRSRPGSECQGVWYYKPVDLVSGIFAKWKVAEESAARIAVGDFQGNNRLSFATISYSVAHYYEAPNPQIRIYYNEFAKPSLPSSMTQFKTAYWNNEALVCVPKPESSTNHEILPLAEVAGFRIELEVLPPDRVRTADAADAIKVLFGAVYVDQEERPRSALSVSGYTIASATVASRGYRASSEGAILMRFSRTPAYKTSWSHTSDIPVKLLFKVSPPDGLQPEFQFTGVDKASPPEVSVRDFWNLRGFQLRFLDQTPLTHIQFWAAGPKVDCTLHNHNDATFGEIHLSLSAGTGNGGMWWLPTPPTIGHLEDNIPTHRESDFKRLPLKALTEHGPIWYYDSVNGKTMRRPDSTVCYPWHKWQAGNEASSMDVWMALEFNADLLDSLTT